MLTKIVTNNFAITLGAGEGSLNSIILYDILKSFEIILISCDFNVLVILMISLNIWN